ncbi:MAG: FliO/MopB family protein [Rickettsiales bacterium]
METVDFTRFFLALAFVIALIWGLAVLAKRTGMDKRLRGITGGQGRLAVVDVLYLDPRRKLTLVRADDREYLLLITADKAEIIERFEKKA